MRWEVRERTDGRKSWDLRGQREIRKDKKKEKKKKERGASEKDFFWGVRSCGETRACRLGREWKWASQAELRRSLKLRSR